MGCCQNSQLKANQILFSAGIKEAIDSSSIKKLKTALNLMSFMKKEPAENFIDQEIIFIGNCKLTALGYCVYLGNEKIFKYLLSKGASMRAMEESMDSQNIRAINLICFKGHMKLLKFYLPLYLKDSDCQQLTDASLTLDFECIRKLHYFDYAIHSACRAGMVSVVDYLCNYFKDKPSVPIQFDIHAVDDCYGEDAGLIACRAGCFNLIKYFHELCGHDFRNLNRNSENAIMICVHGCREQPNYYFLECIRYLIEVVKVDVTYMYEELLLIDCSLDITSYLEEQLEKHGIRIKKKDLEKEKQLSFRQEYNFKDASTSEILKEIKLEHEDSILSSISNDNRSKNFYSSMSDLLN